MSPSPILRPFLLATVTLAQFLGAQQPENPPAGAQPQAPKVVKAPDAPVTVALGQQFTLAAGEHDLGVLVEQAATVLGRNILWKGTERQGVQGNLSVTLNNPVKLTPAAFEELLANLLYAQGFAIVPLDAAKGFYEVIALFGPRAREVMNRAPWRTPEEILARPNQRECVMTMVRLKYINATICTNALRPFFASSGGGQPGSQLTIGNVGNQEAMLLAGFTDQLCAAIRMIRECDVEPTQMPDPMMMQQTGQNPYAPMQAQIKALQEQVAELQKALGLPAKEKEGKKEK